MDNFIRELESIKIIQRISGNENFYNCKYLEEEFNSKLDTDGKRISELGNSSVRNYIEQNMRG
jgi:hypothetical protein